MSSLDLSQLSNQEEAPAVPIDPNALCHKLTILYNPDTQTIQAFDFKNSSDKTPEFKSWPFVMAILGMAVKAAEQLHQQQQMAAMVQLQQQAAAEQQAAMQRAKEIEHNRRNGSRRTG